MKLTFLPLLVLLTAGGLAHAQFEPAGDEPMIPPPPPPKKKVAPPPPASNDGFAPAPAAPAQPAPRKPDAAPPAAPAKKPAAAPANAGPRDAAGEEREIRRIQTNQMRADIVTQTMHKLGYAPEVVTAVSAITFFQFWDDGFRPLEATVKGLWRGLQAGFRGLPFGGGNFYNGLHPHFIQINAKDSRKTVPLAGCVLDFHRSREIPDRIFIRTRACVETSGAYLADKRGFTFAALAHVANGRVDKAVNFTRSDMLLRNDRLHMIFLDGDVFDRKPEREPELNFGE